MTYFGNLSLIQIATPKMLVVIDTLVIEQPVLQRQLKQVFENEGVVKVMHGCNQDLLWLQRDLGLRVVNICDTQRLYM